MDIAKEVLSSSDSLDWSFVASKRDVSIFSRQVADESVQQVKAVTVINAGLENILSHLTNPNRRRGKKDAGEEVLCPGERSETQAKRAPSERSDQALSKGVY